MPWVWDFGKRAQPLWYMSNQLPLRRCCCNHHHPVGLQILFDFIFEFAKVFFHIPHIPHISYIPCCSNAICASWDVAFILSLVVIGSYTIYNQRPSKTTSTVSTKDHKIPQVCSLVNNADLPNLRVAIIATSATLRDARWGPTIPTNLEPSSAKSMFPGLSQRKIWSHVAVIFRGFTGSTKKQHKDHSRSTGHTALLKDHKCGKNSPAGFKSFKSIQIGSKFWKHFTSVTQNDTQT